MSLVNGETQGALFGAGNEGPFAGVVLNRPVDRVWTYRIPPRLRDRLTPGQRVRVPLGRGNTPTMAYCVRIMPVLEEPIDASRIKDVLELVDDLPLIDDKMLVLTRWMANYYACSWGQALDAVVPSGVKKAAGTAIRTFLMVPEETLLTRAELKLPTKQADVLAVLCRAEGSLTLEDVCRLARCGPGPILELRKRGLIHSVKRRAEKPAAALALDDPPGLAPGIAAPLVLTDEQRIAIDGFAPALRADAFATFLLHGVTGSGKTEVYLSAIEQVVARDREAIVLVPEISLTTQTIRRFRRRFTKVAVLHSHLSDVERHRHWKAIASGEVQVVVGARSAIFAPTRRLGLIVIDEEHESTFKQESVPRYHARDVAVKRGQLEGVPVILGSATPSLESWRNSQLGRYTLVSLTKRVADRPMPEVAVIDMRTEKPEHSRSMNALSPVLEQGIREALDDGGQVMLLLNRRGFHTFILCPGCGNVLKCDACDVALTHHKGRNLVVCHICDAERVPPSTCSKCGVAQLHFGGVGTERLEREVKNTFSDRVVRRMDSDTMRSPGSHEKVLRAFKDGQIDILLGTQMIAKGLDFPEVTLVGVVSADTALHLPDFRAAERTFQLVAQVAGRTGRGDRPGKVLVQTYCPDAPAIQHAVNHDYLSFVAGELPERESRGAPPFGRLVRLIARGLDEKAVSTFMQTLAEGIAKRAEPGVRMLGPAPAPVSRIRNQFRFHLSLRAPTAKPLQTLIHQDILEASPPTGVELAVDVDPVSML